MPLSYSRNFRFPGEKRRRTFTNRRRTTTNVFKQIKNVKKSVKKINDKIELNYKDINVNSAGIAAGTFFLLNGLTKGDNVGEREGNQITSTSVQWRFQLVGDPESVGTTTGRSRRMRMIVFWDRQPNGVAPPLTGDDGLLDISIAVQPIVAPYNYDTQKRYKILWDRYTTIMPTAAVAAGNLYYGTKMVRGKRKLSRTTKYDSDNAGDITDIQTNSLYVVFIGDSEGTIVVDGNLRFFYKDA